jgi:cytochrome c2
MPALNAVGTRLRPAIAATAVGGLLLVGGCVDGNARRNAEQLTGGNVETGKQLIIAFGCRSCHQIPGVPGADGRVGPPLEGIARRTYIAGVLANSPSNMVRWLMDPPAVDSLTAMPRVGLDERAARNVASYLYTLR